MRGKVHAGKAQYAYSYVRTCVTAQVRRTLMHTKRIRSKRWKQVVNCGTATHATRDGIAIRRPMRGKARAGKKNHTHTHMCNTCAHAYVPTCLRACVRTYVRIYARTHVRMYAYEYAYDVFPREPSHAEIFTSRCDTVTRRGTVVCRMYVRTGHVPMCACAHVRTYEYAYDVFPAWAFPRIGLCESRYRSLPLVSDPFKKRTSVRLTCAATTAHNYGLKKRINKFFWQNWRRFCIFSTTCTDSGCQNVKKSPIKIEKNLGRSLAYVRVYMYIRTYFTWYSR